MLSIQRVRHGALADASLELGPGLAVVLGAESLGTLDLVDLVVGDAAPRSGRVRIAGRDPRRSPESRRAMASLVAHEELFPARTVLDAVTLALRACGSALPASEALERCGLGGWSKSDPRALSAAERRSVAACVAFTREKPVLAILHEPLARLPGIADGVVVSSIERWIGGGALVLCTTSSPAAAYELGGGVWFLDRGQLVRVIDGTLPFEFAPGSVTTLLVRTNQPRELARALSAQPSVTSVTWNDVSQPYEICVQGGDAAEVALVLCRTAAAQRISITAILPALPDLAMTQAATAGYLRGAYDAAYRAALQPPQPPPFRLPQPETDEP
jgi:ABC-2 type transport system ATP-binding protein